MLFKYSISFNKFVIKIEIFVSVKNNNKKSHYDMFKKNERNHKLLFVIYSKRINLV